MSDKINSKDELLRELLALIDWRGDRETEIVVNRHADLDVRPWVTDEFEAELTALLAEDEETIQSSSATEDDAVALDPSESSISFIDGYDVGINQFTCRCGTQVVGWAEDRRNISGFVYPDWDRSLDCPGCGREWRLVDDGAHWEVRKNAE